VGQATLYFPAGSYSVSDSRLPFQPSQDVSMITAIETADIPAVNALLFKYDFLFPIMRIYFKRRKSNHYF